jgi:GR25 family glycosyltransferase involved in LPS biosynthesis
VLDALLVSLGSQQICTGPGWCLCRKKTGFDMCWEYFDKIYCISVKEREDRRAEARAQFARVGVLARVEFSVVKRHPTNAEQGIYESHMNAIRSGIRGNAKNILIFEDDIMFDRFSPDTLRRCTEFLSTNPTWKILFLGCLVKGSRRTKNKSVLKIRYRCLTQAYVINSKFAETIVDKSWEGISFDGFLRLVRDDVYVSYPSFAFQSNSPSDNTYVRLDIFRRLFGGLGRIQRGNEFYHHHKAIIYAIHAIVILVFLLR